MKIDYDTLKQFRRTLHANPEVSESEIETAKRVTEFLKNCNPDELITDIGGTGIIATWDSGKEGNEIVFRAELDALPIQEINTFDYASTIEGVSHKCGHDGHATILCGLAKYLSENKTTQGKVRLLFQPAEENGEGAKAMLADKKFQNIQPDYIFALHNLPAYPLHEIVVKENSFTAAVNSIIINLHGKTSHAAEPENGINPALAVAEIITHSIAGENNNPEKEDMRVITPVCIELGEKSYGVSAGEANVHLTLRCLDNTHLRQLEKEIETLSKAIAERYNLKIDFEYTQTFFANVNDKSATAIVKKSALKNNLSVTERSYPFKWGEDFGLFTTKFKGCMFGLGAGENTPSLHNPDYDFPDALIETGVRIFSGIIDQLNTNN